MRLDETLQAQASYVAGFPVPLPVPQTPASVLHAASAAGRGTAFIYLDVFDRAVDICRQRSCANCCSSPALAELDTVLRFAHCLQVLRSECSSCQVIFAPAELLPQSSAELDTAWQCARAAVAAAVPPL